MFATGCGAGVSPDSTTDAGLTLGGADGTVVGPRTITVEAGLSASAKVLAEAEAIVADAKHSTYSHDTYVDEATGTYELDCSGFTDFVLAQVAPAGFAELRASAGERPRAFGYVTFFESLAVSSAWERVTIASQLVPGDIVAWKEPASIDSVDTGHVVVVAAPPFLDAGELTLAIIDSTIDVHGHADTRIASGMLGVGEGTMRLLIDASGAPTGYRWSTESVSIPYTTPIALGHLR